MSNENKYKPIIIKIEEGKGENELEKSLLLLGLLGAGLMLPSILTKHMEETQVTPEEYKKVELIDIKIK